MNIIDEAKEFALSGKVLSRDMIIKLLEIPLDSEEDKLLREAAYEVSMKKCEGKAYIWSAVGADYAPCLMNCKFCSFGKKWNIVKNQVHYSNEEIIEKAREFVLNGARYIVLRTTEFYSIPKLLEIVKELREKVDGEYEVIFNTGELDMTISNLMVESGVNGVYHACRIREGVDTPFDPWDRKNTMGNIHRSGLKLISLVEPIGVEHSNEEIADNFIQLLKYEPVISGAMARIPVPGTPLGEFEKISDSKLAHIIAVLRLSGGDIVKDICVHPVSLEALKSGANVMVVETGAIPRDVNYEMDSWHGVDMQMANKLLNDAGYKVFNK